MLVFYEVSVMNAERCISLFHQMRAEHPFISPVLSVSPTDDETIFIRISQMLFKFILSSEKVKKTRHQHDL